MSPGQNVTHVPGPYPFRAPTVREGTLDCITAHFHTSISHRFKNFPLPPTPPLKNHPLSSNQEASGSPDGHLVRDPPSPRGPVRSRSCKSGGACCRTAESAVGLDSRTGIPAWQIVVKDGLSGRSYRPAVAGRVVRPTSWKRRTALRKSSVVLEKSSRGTTVPAR